MQTIIEQNFGRLRLEFSKRGPSSYFREIVATLRNATKIPMGYQDMAGFHFGVERYASDVAPNTNPTPLVLKKRFLFFMERD
jgi:hypothetical protein